MDNRMGLILKYTDQKAGFVLDLGGRLSRQEQEFLVSEGVKYKAVGFHIEELKKIENIQTKQKIAAICLRLLSDCEQDIDEVVEILTSIMRKNDAPLFLMCKRGDGIESFQTVFSKYGVMLKCNRLLTEFFEGDPNNTLFAEGTLVNQYLNWLDAVINPNIGQDFYVGVIENKTEVAPPFLSIITRTQGRRPEALRETLLGLSAQTDEDFEVLVIGHKLDKLQENMVKEIIEETPFSLQSKIRFIQLDRGNRTAPINEGFRHAKGKYAVILDDDDVVFDNWVEEFKKQYMKTPGAVLHAYTIAQEWMTIDADSKDEALRACGSPMSIYCKKFNWLTELHDNTCPPVGLAFPVYPFKKWGVEFDETLDTTEDWDYLMRVGFLCGVSDIKVPTCIYRLWVNAESSHTVHSEELWKKNHEMILKKFEETPIVLPRGYSNKVNVFIESKGNIVDGGDTEGVLSGEKCPLYLDLGKGFSEKDVIRESGSVEDGEFKYVYTLPGKNIHRFRWDPTENKDKLIEKLEITFKDAKGNVYNVIDRGFKTNGVKIKNQICFYKNDPQIVFRCKGQGKCSEVTITGKIVDGIPDEYFDLIFNRRWKSIMRNCVKRIYHKIKG